MRTESWCLHEGFITAEIDRLNHPEYFSQDFVCPDLDSILLKVNTSQQALQNRQQLNQFFDNLIDSNGTLKCLFVRFKWLVYLHRLIQLLEKGSIMYGLVLKALQIYSDKFSHIKVKFEGFNKYFCNRLFQPYMQYLSKLCLLNIPNQTQEKDVNNKENINNINNSNNFSSENKKNPAELLKWYRQYNFILETLESFSNILKDQNNFFKTEFPFFINMRRQLGKDLKVRVKELKQCGISLEEVNMTMIELDKLQAKIFEFLKGDDNIFETSQSVLMAGIEDCSKQEITNFMCTPLKSNSYNCCTQ